MNNKVYYINVLNKGNRGRVWVKFVIKDMLFVIPPLEKGGIGGFENIW